MRDHCRHCSKIHSDDFVADGDGGGGVVVAVVFAVAVDDAGFSRDLLLVVYLRLTMVT